MKTTQNATPKTNKNVDEKIIESKNFSSFLCNAGNMNFQNLLTTKGNAKINDTRRPTLSSIIKTSIGEK